MSDELSPEEQFDVLVAQIEDRMAEYLVALREIPNVSPGLKGDLWNAAVRKRDEIDALQSKLATVKEQVAEEAPAQPSRSAVILQHACRAAGWDVGTHNSARTLIHACREQVATIRDPVARNSALQWLARALTYAEADRRSAAVTCVTNAKSLLGR